MESLFDNPFILFIIIGILSTLFNRLKGPQQEDQKRPPARPVSPQQREYVPEKTPEVYRHVEIEKSKSKLEQEFEQRKRETQEKLRTLKDLQRANEAKAKRYTDLSRTKKPDDSSTIQSASKSVILPNQDRLVEGIILAEVLGPPRSRKRHTMLKNK